MKIYGHPGSVGTQLVIAAHRQFANADCRFDVVFADGDPERPNLRWLRDAFRADDP